MKTMMSLMVALAIAATPASVALAQGKPQTLTKLQATEVATGYRSSKIIGSEVYNESSEVIGKVDDLIVTPKDRVVYAIVSIGGFLGMGDRLVAVPYERLTVSPNKIVLAGASKDNLKAWPEFRYVN